MPDTIILGLEDRVADACFMDTEAAFAATGYNTGNLAFHYALNRVLGGRQAFHAWTRPAAELDQMAAIGVVPCANQLGPHLDYSGLGQHFAKLERMKLVTVGLGAQSSLSYADMPEVPEGTRAWVREIVARAPAAGPNIGVRGPFSLKVLAHYGLAERAIVTGCPTLFINRTRSWGARLRSGRPNPGPAWPWRAGIRAGRIWRALNMPWRGLWSAPAAAISCNRRWSRFIWPAAKARLWTAKF